MGAFLCRKVLRSMAGAPSLRENQRLIQPYQGLSYAAGLRTNLHFERSRVYHEIP